MTMIGKHVEEFARDLPGEVAEAGRQVWLAGLGVVGMAGNTTQAVFGMLVDEGQKVQKAELKRMDRLVTKTSEEITDQLHTLGRFVEDGVQKTTKTVLSRLGLPSRKDVSDLTVRVDQLAAKVDTLKAKRRVSHGG
jgi:poly(hydroxyalkanoate) granule-associated protein